VLIKNGIFVVAGTLSYVSCTLLTYLFHQTASNKHDSSAISLKVHRPTGHANGQRINVVVLNRHMWTAGRLPAGG